MDVLSFLFRELPWARQLVAWLMVSALILVVWALVAIPAFLIQPIVQRARMTTKIFSDHISTAYFAVWRECAARAGAQFNSFFEMHSVRYLRDRNKELWQRGIDLAAREVRDLKRVVETAKERLDGSLGRLYNALSDVKKIDLRVASLPPLPTADDVGAETASAIRDSARERMNLILTGTIVAAIVVVNTGMLSQILRDALPATSLKVGGDVRLYHVFAAMLTLVEAGVGILYGRLSRQNISTDPSYVGRIAVACSALGIGFIEGLFYSRVGSKDEIFHIPLVEIDFSMQDAFFVWGFILPMMLFGLGHQFYRSLDALAGSRASRKMRRRLKKWSDLTDKLSQALQQAGGRLTRVRDDASLVQKEVPLFSETQAAKVSESLTATVTAFEKMKASTPDWALKTTEAASNAEQRQQALRTAVLLLVSAIAVGFSVWLQSVVIPAMYPVSDVVALAIALLDCAALLAAGLLLRTRATVVHEDEGILRAIEGRGALLSSVLAAVMTGFFLLTGLIVLWRTAGPSGHGLAWAVVIGIGIGLVALGAELPSAVALALCAVRAAVVLLEGVLAAAAAWLLRGLVGVLFVAEFAIGLLAAPVEWIGSHRRRG